MTAESSSSEFFVSDDPALLDLTVIHDFLSTSYWAASIPRHIVETAVRNSLGFGIYQPDTPRARQVGFARVVTDYATFAYLADVFVLEPHRGKGLSALLMRSIMAHPNLQGLRRWMLCTRDAHALYSKFGFTSPKKPETYMERHDPTVYTRA